MHEFLAQLVNGISLGGIYALIAIGYTMVYGIAELINFATATSTRWGRSLRWRSSARSASRASCTASRWS